MRASRTAVAWPRSRWRAIGVVFGDIGTSPLYAMQTVFSADDHAVKTTHADVYGVVSLVFWAIVIIVSIKYVTFIMRADNGGEGGIMALTALIQRTAQRRRIAHAGLLIALGVFGASLFYGDGMITPAISVLSAVEGLKVAEPSLLAPRRADRAGRADRAVRASSAGGRPRSGGCSGRSWSSGSRCSRSPARREIAAAPGVLRALSPSYAVAFFVEHFGIAFIAHGLGGAGGDRRRGALRRHGPLRARADPPRLVLRRLPGADAELPRPGRR